MSGVLERMVLRTRSALAGIEPLFAPHYATSEVFHQAENRSAGARAPAPRQRRTEPGQAARITPRDRAPAPSSPVTPAFSEEIAGATSSPRQDPVADHVQLSLADLSSDVPPAPPATTPAQREEPAAGEPIMASARTGSTGGATTPSAPSRMALGHNTASQDLFDDGAGPVPISKKHSAPGAPAPAAPAQVTISIGHVEVRAAPVSQPPRRPAFRPRVTLDEYLRRSGDSR
jgi:hypothetical protein